MAAELERVRKISGVSVAVEKKAPGVYCGLCIGGEMLFFFHNGGTFTNNMHLYSPNYINWKIQ